LQQVQLRNRGSEPGPIDFRRTIVLIIQLTEIRIHILSGRVDDATLVMNKHFPSVLSVTHLSPSGNGIHSVNLR